MPNGVSPWQRSILCTIEEECTTKTTAEIGQESSGSGDIARRQKGQLQDTARAEPRER
jgi:hypothetical protein